MGFNFESYGSEKPVWFDKLPDEGEDINKENLKEFFYLIEERQEIWYKRFMLKQERPWTNNKILNDYKFTNVYRELDRASQWLIQNVLLDHSINRQDLIWKIMCYRFFNEPDSFRDILPTNGKYNSNKGFIKLPNYNDFDDKKMWEEAVTCRESGKNPFHTAYMMNLAFLKKTKENTPKRGLFKDFAYIRHLLPILHEKVPEINKILVKAKSPEEIVKFLETVPATSSFQSHEFYIDFCYAARYWKKPLMKFDQNDFTNVGPGASLGIRLILPSLKPEEQLSGIYVLRDMAGDFLSKNFKYLNWDKVNKKYFVENQQTRENFTLHQIEMVACEFQKYWKMKLKVGKQRSKFKPKTKI